MAWSASPAERIADLERLVHDVEHRLARLRRTASRGRREAPAAFDRWGDTVTGALNEVAGRIRGRADSAGSDAAQLGEEALRLGNDALRKLTRDVEQRPLLMLAIAAGVGALAAGLLARRI